tara:strand:+ start:9158 stop:9649 length:492 start_codon:yes stop_codon:yes gene_type:complete
MKILTVTDNQQTAAVELDLQVASESSNLPSESQLQLWVEAALASRRDNSELSLRIVDESESQQLNGQYRQKDKPTNVLSFPADLPDELELPLLGDLVVCAPIVAREAVEQNKTQEAHWAHMLVHGTLHLLGYDHIEEADATEMEALETRIITKLGFPPPYEID